MNKPHPTPPVAPLVLLGAGGHAKVLQALAEITQHEIAGVCDPHLAAQGQSSWRGIPVLGGDDVLIDSFAGDTRLINGVGQRVGSSLREDIYNRMRAAGFHFPILIHPSAWLASSTKVADGAQIMAGVVIQPDSSIGSNSIINTAASIDHDCIIDAHVHIAPGAIICGGVHVAAGAFVGAGAVILPGLKIGARSVVGAGTTLARNLAADQTWLGTASRLNPL